MPQYNPNDSRQISRLRRAIDYSTQRLRPYREHYVDLVRHYAGDYYGESSVDTILPVNMIRVAVDIWSRHLSANAPKGLVKTQLVAWKGTAEELELALDYVIDQIRYADAMNDVVKSALFQMGIMKVGLTELQSHEALGYLHDAGIPFADSVLFTDWVHDINALRQEQWDFCGNRYRLRYDDVMDDPSFENKNNLRPSQTGGFSGLGQGGDARVESISKGNVLSTEEYVDHVELWDIWLPRDGLLVTLPQEGDTALKVVEWQGPETGPYHTLGFGTVPGNPLPAGQVTTIFELHDILNRLFAKLADQGERQKTIGLASQAATADGTAGHIRDARDGDVISTSHPDAVRDMRFPGVDQQNLAFTIWLKQTLSYIGGNLDVVGGLSSQAETLGQERLLAQQSSQMIEDMQKKVEAFAKSSLSAIAYYLHTDPISEIPLTKRSPGGLVELPFTWGPERRSHEFFTYAIDVRPYSTQPRSPAQQMQLLTQVVKEMILPMMQVGIFAQQGLTFDLAGYFKLMSKYGDMDELNDLLKTSGGNLTSQPETPGPGGSPGGQGIPTTRNYVRKNVPTGGTQQSRDATLMQTLLGGGAQVNPDQYAAMAR